MGRRAWAVRRPRRPQLHGRSLRNVRGPPMREWRRSFIPGSRRLLLAAAKVVLAVALLSWNSGRTSSARDDRPFKLTTEDEAFLEDLQRRSFRYFDEQADPTTGQVRDRARTDGSA